MKPFVSILIVRKIHRKQFKQRNLINSHCDLSVFLSVYDDIVVPKFMNRFDRVALSIGTVLALLQETKNSFVPQIFDAHRKY